jgi:hypothetical protein
MLIRAATDVEIQVVGDRELLAEIRVVGYL